jgi:hypothetical protein
MKFLWIVCGSIITLHGTLVLLGAMDTPPQWNVGAWGLGFGLGVILSAVKNET